MVAPGQEPVAANEVDDVCWASPGEAADRLDYAHDRKLLDSLGGAMGKRQEDVFLVRHAKAGNREKWQEPDELRPLTKPGWQQAEALAGVLGGERVAALVSSPYVRCIQTLEPLGEDLDLPVQEHDALAEEVRILRRSSSSARWQHSARSRSRPTETCRRSPCSRSPLGASRRGPARLREGLDLGADRAPRRGRGWALRPAACLRVGLVGFTLPATDEEVPPCPFTRSSSCP